MEFTFVYKWKILRLKEFITLHVNNVLCHNSAQYVWLLYIELDTLLNLYYYEVLVL